MNHLLPEDFKRVRCPQCDGDVCHEVMLTSPNVGTVRGTFAIVRCDGCGLTYSNPRLSDAALSAAYATLEDYAGTPAADDSPPPAGAVAKVWRHLTQRQVVGDWVERGPVLDVGCHIGDLLMTLKARGIVASGIETSPAALERCRARGLDVKHGSTEGVVLQDSSYWTITLSHVLEHVADPIAVLRKLWRALIPGGRIVIAVPNHRGLAARLFGAHWHGWDPPFHLIHFDAASLRSVLEKAGFRVERVMTRGTPDDVTRSLGKLLGRRTDALWLRAALLPGTRAVGSLELGGELCAVATRPEASEPPPTGRS